MKERSLILMDLNYQLKKRPIKISQGYHGPWSHCPFKMIFPRGEVVTDDTYSVDFEVPFDTEVFASKEGRIEKINLSEKYYEGSDFSRGIRTSPSQIIINHGDNLSLYAHLGTISDEIQQDAHIKKGQLIGKTGKTGWIGPTPHLHFEVFGPYGYVGTRLSIPCNFEDYNKSLEHSQIGRNS